MAESEEKQEAEQEAEAPVEAEAPAASEPKHEEPPPQAPPPQEPSTQEPSPQEPSSHEPPPQDPPPEEPPPPAPPPQEVKKPETAPLRASLDRRRDMSADTFSPPSPGRKSVRSSLAGGRRLTGSERNLTIQRKSRFGRLGSKAQMVLGSIVDIKSTAAEMLERKVAKYQNTYKLDSDNPFNSEKVDKILREVMDETLENLNYNPEKCASTAKAASTQIRNKVKLLEFERYKLVCVVSIGEKNSQDVYATCRFLWDAEKDRYSFYSLENTYVYGIAYCFGLYYE